MKKQAEEQVDTQMKTVTNVNNIQNMDVDKVVKLLQEQGLPQDFVNDVLEFMKNKTQENTSQAPVAPSPGVPQTMNPIPKVMKPIGHLNSAVQYLAVWAEPAKPLGPNADIPNLAEAADEEGMDLEKKPEPSKKEMSSEEAKKLGESMGIKWEAVKFTPEALAQGYKVELEHGTISPDTNITDDDPTMTAKIAWAHLNEHADYYNGLQQMEDALTKSEGSSGVTASSIRRYAVTVRELQQTILPQLEDQLFEIDAALQSGMVEDARAALFEATATLGQIKQKISTLGDVDPMTFGLSEEPQQKSLVDKLLGR
jgi:hypothetical protein